MARPGRGCGGQVAEVVVFSCGEEVGFSGGVGGGVGGAPAGGAAEGRYRGSLASLQSSR